MNIAESSIKIKQIMRNKFYKYINKKVFRQKIDLLLEENKVTRCPCPPVYNIFSNLVESLYLMQL